MSEDDIEYRQGRRKEQVEGNAVSAMIGLIGIMSILLFLSLFDIKIFGGYRFTLPVKSVTVLVSSKEL